MAEEYEDPNQIPNPEDCLTIAISFAQDVYTCDEVEKCVKYSKRLEIFEMNGTG